MSHNELKLVILGDGGVGKSALTMQFVSNYFLDEYDPTMDEDYRKQAVVDDETVLFDILDSAGQEEFETLEDQWISHSEAFLLVFSLNSWSTFDSLESRLNRIMRVKDVEDVEQLQRGCDREQSGPVR